MAGLTNGCGACGGFWRWFKPPHKNFFVKECNRHDEAYGIGGTPADRKKADCQLFFDMVDKSVSYYRGRKTLSLWWFVTLSFAYYYAVRCFGKRRFKNIPTEERN
ncbi:hypothetical protein [Soonwooa sp.]|uniref:hypothetical protein n=1 Tax=Soonwooa sp. TaxID=1938592 RepID=UPI0028B226F5|nr:hypothetical protein [Soonwooa sp.]